MIRSPFFLSPSAVIAAACLAAACALPSAAAVAAEFRSIGAAPAILYDAPGERGRKLFVAPRGMPVEVVLTYRDWCKVRDASGDLAWVEAKALADKRNVIVRAATARVHSGPEDSTPVVFVAERGVLLELGEGGRGGWVRVHHRDGLAGFVKAAEVWGE